MNQNAQTHDLAAVNNGVGTGTADMLFTPGAMQTMQEFARAMAQAKVSLPKHLQGAPADCMAVLMQAAQWRMNPFAVAQKTHLTQGGALGYEAQLVNAVVLTMAPVTGRPEFEFLGDWNKILGKVTEKHSERGGKYYVAAWDKADEKGLGVVIRWGLKGEPDPRAMTVMLSQCWPRFSTQWATDPQQQITYVAVKKFARRYCPDVILGVYTPDELEAMPHERDIQGEVLSPEPGNAPEQSHVQAAKDRVRQKRQRKKPDPSAETPKDEPDLEAQILARVGEANDRVSLNEVRRQIKETDWPQGVPEQVAEAVRSRADHILLAEIHEVCSVAKSPDDLEQAKEDAGKIGDPALRDEAVQAIEACEFALD